MVNSNGLVNQMIEKALDGKPRHSMTMKHQRGGLYFKLGKDICKSFNHNHCINVFEILQENPQ
jgi:hypothetical protein